MVKLMASCCNCGHVLGRSVDGTQTDVRCPKCGAEITYAVEKNAVTVRLVSRTEGKQTVRSRRTEKKIWKN